MKTRHVEFKTGVEYADGVFDAEVEATCVKGMPGNRIDPDEPPYCEEMEVWVETSEGWDDIADEISVEEWIRLEDMALEFAGMDEDDDGENDAYDRANDR